MQPNASFVKQAIEAMSAVAEISYRRIFNGTGIYHRGVQFAIILQEHLYFRANEDSRCLFEAKLMPAFQPRGADAVESFFFQLPEEVLTKPDELKYWMRIAVEASHQGEFLDDEASLDISIKHSRQAI